MKVVTVMVPDRGWLMAIETLRLVDPEFRMVVCLRDPVQVFDSIEAQHQKTLPLSFPNHIAPHSAYARTDTRFGLRFARPRIVAEIHKNCRWFYPQFYPEQPPPLNFPVIAY